MNMTLLAILASRERTTESTKKTTSQINTATTVNFYTGNSTTESVQVIWDQPTGTTVPNYVVTLENVGGGVLTTATVPSTDVVNGRLDFTFHAPQPGTSYISKLYALMNDGTRLPLATLSTSSGCEY